MHCYEEDFLEVAAHEHGTKPEVQLEAECSCSCPVSIDELLQQDLERTNDRLSEFCNATMSWMATHTSHVCCMHFHTISVCVCLL